MSTEVSNLLSLTMWLFVQQQTAGSKRIYKNVGPFIFSAYQKIERGCKTCLPLYDHSDSF